MVISLTQLKLLRAASSAHKHHKLQYKNFTNTKTGLKALYIVAFRILTHFKLAKELGQMSMRRKGLKTGRQYIKKVRALARSFCKITDDENWKPGDERQ
ncbi:hypothetical protein CW740_03890 [Kangiella profundi]|uniref:Uncharacterized protein n=1 Tax=Kangiella profundi TaxID=1561924 RepID=A0A2K9AAI3_9GAMM|nr:hypothetical protein CW740_03890 [Kangiella profundi]